MRNSIITGIVVLFIGGLITKFIFDDKTELRYVVSDRIPTNFFDGDETESIQQLEILNTGDTELQRIIIKVKTNIIEYYIQKVTSSDSVIVSKTNNILEVLYPQIPPDGNIKIIFKSVGNGINIDDLDIKHSKGSAKPALATNNTVGFAALVLILLYLIFTILGLRSLLIDNIASKVYYKPYDNILQRSKPWYLTLEKWKEIRENSIKYVFGQDFSFNVINSLFYQILDTEKQKFITDEEWIKLKLAAQNRLLRTISDDINNNYNWETDKYISLKRPKYIDDDVWEKIKSAISKAFTTSCVFNVDDYINQIEITELLKSSKPEIVNENDWEKYRSFLLKFDSLVKQTKLVEKQTKQNNTLSDNLHNLVFGIELKEKPEELSADSWYSLKSIENNIFLKSEQVKKELMEIREIKLETFPLKEKLDKQLRIINEVLNDSTVIDRIEDYSNPFSKGNFDNLKRIAQLTKNK